MYGYCVRCRVYHFYGVWGGGFSSPMNEILEVDGRVSLYFLLIKIPMQMSRVATLHLCLVLSKLPLMHLKLLDSPEQRVTRPSIITRPCIWQLLVEQEVGLLIILTTCFSISPLTTVLCLDNVIGNFEVMLPIVLFNTTHEIFLVYFRALLLGVHYIYE